jgi:hypothetical protein
MISYIDFSFHLSSVSGKCNLIMAAFIFTTVVVVTVVIIVTVAAVVIYCKAQT